MVILQLSATPEIMVDYVMHGHCICIYMYIYTPASRHNDCNCLVNQTVFSVCACARLAAEKYIILFLPKNTAGSRVSLDTAIWLLLHNVY